MGEEQTEQEKEKEQGKDLHVHIPWELAERIRAYAVENNSTAVSVVIEAVDTFLRKQKNKAP
ncbi:MAG: hypothetical protein JW882_02715 [Deltaproteobacteria bacterium]|nr:hypothetical protein [Deltaproteobacteria bacterium]